MNRQPCTLIESLRNPDSIGALAVNQWDELIPQARRALLLGRLFHLTAPEPEVGGPAAQASWHLESADVVSQGQVQTINREVKELLKVGALLRAPIILLKGAAYVKTGLPCHLGRYFSDIDILFDRSLLKSAESVLSLHGWRSTETEAYNVRYFREWMHEIPPLRHYKRGTTLDVHHTILPPTAKYSPDPDKIINAAIEIVPGLKVLCPEDMVIHSATHLFHEGELEHGLRDLVDIHELLQHFGGNEPGFWQRLVPRAIELDLVHPLYYGLHYAQEILGTSIPANVMRDVMKGAPGMIMRPIMDWLFIRALRPDHSSCDLPGTGLARWLLYVRSHYLKMPMRLLLPHLARKAWMRRFAKPDNQPPVPQQAK